jgi:hypothetical protein
MQTAAALPVGAASGISSSGEGPSGGAAVASPEPRGGVLPWVLRGVLALAALAAPILVFRGFTDSEVPDPEKQQRLREASRPAVEPPVSDPTIARP